MQAVEKELHRLSILPKWQIWLFNNRIANRAGRLLHYLGNVLTFRTKVYGWGTDYNAIDGRYLYYKTGRLRNYFKK